jgi:iron complex transport system ATP-binding protein
MTGLLVENIALRLGGRRVLDGVDLAAGPGTIHGVIGPNGAGKSSLLRLVAGLHRPEAGRVAFEGADVVAMSRRQRATCIAMTEQSPVSDVRLDGRAVVMLGRIPYQSALQAEPSAQDHAAVSRALEAVGMAARADAEYHTLSGGEQQRLHIARALAQEPRLLLLDEPTNHLDVQAQLAILMVLRRSAAAGLTVVVAIHDLNLAAEHCDAITVLHRGRTVAAGHPAAIVTAPMLRDVYGVAATVLASPVSGRPLVAYHAPADAAGTATPLRRSA